MRTLWSEIKYMCGGKINYMYVGGVEVCALLNSLIGIVDRDISLCNSSRLYDATAIKRERFFIKKRTVEYKERFSGSTTIAHGQQTEELEHRNRPWIMDLYWPDKYIYTTTNIILYLEKLPSLTTSLCWSPSAGWSCNVRIIQTELLEQEDIL